MRQTHSHTVNFTLLLADSETLEIKANIDFTIIPGAPERGPSFASGGEPADPAEIDIEGIELVVPNFNAAPNADGTPAMTTTPCPDWIAGFIRESVEVYTELGESAHWGEPYEDPDSAYERQRDAATMDIFR